MTLFWWRVSWDTSMYELGKKKATLEWKLRHVSFNHRWDQMRGSFSFKTFHQYLSMVLAFIHSFAQYLSMILQHSLIHSLSKHLRSTYLHPALSQALETHGWTKQALVLWYSCFSEESDDRENNSRDTGKCLHTKQGRINESISSGEGGPERPFWEADILQWCWEVDYGKHSPKNQDRSWMDFLLLKKWLEDRGRRRREAEVFATQWECWRDPRREGRSSVIKHTDRIEASREMDQVGYY